MSSADEFPSVTLPLSVAAPEHVSAAIEKSFVPSEVPLIMSVKFVFTCVASAAVPLVKVFVTDTFAIIAPARCGLDLEYQP
jgi:hypothetical protein